MFAYVWYYNFSARQRSALAPGVKSPHPMNRHRRLGVCSHQQGQGVGGTPDPGAAALPLQKQSASRLRAPVCCLYTEQLSSLQLF